jgi:hypothetical protein
MYRHHFRDRFLATLAGLHLSLAGIAGVAAQPGSSEMSQLQAQLAELQSRLNAIDSASAGQDDDRVKTVGRSTGPSRPVETEETFSVRLYDLSDVFAVSPQYPAMWANEFTGERTPVFELEEPAQVAGGMGGGGFGGGGVQGTGRGGSFNIPPVPPTTPQEAQTLGINAARVTMPALIDAIQSAVEPEVWETEEQASIRILGNTLLISATDSMHQQIGTFVNLLREHWGKLRTVSVTAYWIKAQPEEIAELLESPEGAVAGVGLVDQTAWTEFLRTASTNERLVYSATLNGHNGQTLHSVSGQERTVVVDGIPVESTIHDRELETVVTEVVGLLPERRQFHEGAVLQVTPLATRGGNFLVLDLHTRVAELLDAADDVIRPAISIRDRQGNRTEMMLDRAEYASCRLSTTIRCPKDRVVLAGGMTYDKALSADRPGLYLFVRTAIHTIQEDVSDNKPQPLTN